MIRKIKVSEKFFGTRREDGNVQWKIIKIQILSSAHEKTNTKFHFGNFKIQFF
jgi:hypothetical protein